MSNLEKRLAEVERKLEVWERRRAKLIPPELIDDPNVIELCADHVKSAVAGWRQCLDAHGVSLKEARMHEMQRQALRELEDAGKAESQRLAAQVWAVTQFYEKHGFLPEGCGFEIVDDGFEPINTKVF